MSTDRPAAARRSWWPHVVTLVLMLLYLPTLLLTRSAVEDMVQAILYQKHSFVFALLAAGSYVAVGLGFFVLILGPTFRYPSIPKVTRIVLALYWVPHLLVTFPCTAVYGTNNWIP